MVKIDPVHFKKTLIPLALILVSCVVLSSCGRFGPPATKRVACVGDSITFGLGIEDRVRNSYPSQLGVLLGNGWEVRNFGVNGATVLKNGDYPYMRTQAYREALAFLPQIVIIQLGTNDSWTENWQFRDDYVRDYIALIESFQALESRPKIWLCTIIPAYRGGGGRPDRLVRDEVIPRIREIAKRKGLPIIDLNSVFEGRMDLFADPLHPNAVGARLMAETIAGAIAERKREARSR